MWKQARSVCAAYLLGALVVWGSSSAATPKAPRPNPGTATKPTKRRRAPAPKPIVLGPAPKAEKSRATKEQDVPTIVVTGARRRRKLKDTVTQVEVITRKEIKQTSAQRLSELLETRLGIQVSATAGAGQGIQIQGLSSKHVLLLVDGQRMNGRVRGVLDLDRFPLEQIERIEIVKGATSALYGSDAIGGVINIITRKNKKPFVADLATRYGYGGSHMLDLSGTAGFFWKGWSGRLSISWSRYDAWDLDPSTPATTGSNDHLLQVGGHTAYTFSPKVQLSLTGNYQHRDRAGIDNNSVGAVYDRKNRTETAFTAAFLNAILSSVARLRWKTSMAYFRDQFLYEQRGGINPATLQETTDLLVQSVGQLDFGIGKSHFLSIGVDGLYEQINTPRVRDEQAVRGRLALFAQYEWMLEAPIRISVVPGFRVAYDSQYAISFNPKLSARIDPIKGLAIRASYGWGLRAPDFKELYLTFENTAAGYVVSGNPSLKPELARSLQVGIEYTQLKWMTLRANVYRNDLENLINTRTLTNTGPSQQITYENIDAAITQGVEAQVAFQHQKFLQLTLGYTFLWSEDLATKQSLLGRAAHRANFNVLAQLPSLGLRLVVRGALVGPREVEEDADADGTTERLTLPAYLQLHARLGYSFWRRRFELYAALHNILNTGDTRWLPLRPRTLFLGLRFSYHK